ncbi:hypothetical protein C5708_06055 [Caulobacter sp. CCUG 60055]|uniref:gamma-butyrobetaine hydroxylase-like domain-containing protein n=1 Tax=Caulobacter sp. CCUG 60055 TaxID=2100090 RepID=UPI001FA6FF26|nr:DUF971 domain-containing protein [Caulobacter sp. CCUG 60055]MCI3179814.1 hypothetical protein [Caulobacter sp. CCUG 60055]
MSRPWPTELRVRRGERTLTASFDDGASFVLDAEYLRVMTASALDRGHGAGPGRTVAGKRGVGLVDVRPVGRYAVRIAFDDGHASGFYGWDALYRLGRDRDALWADYLARLEREGLDRG